jgi:hypothetical protein
MVQVASLRIQIEAQQAVTAAQQVRRELDGVTTSATKTEISTDKLEKQMAELLAVTNRVAVNTHASAVATQRLGQMQTTAAVVVDRTTDKLVKQEKAGFKLSAMFGSLAARTASTGGAFLAADFLARVAGANSLMDGLNKTMNLLAESFRSAFTEADSFAEALIKAGKAKPIADADLAALLAGAGASKGGVPGAVFPGTTLPLNLSKSALENDTLLNGITRELALFEQDVASARATRDRILAGGDADASRQALERTKQFEVFRASEAQSNIDRMTAFFADMPKAAENAKAAIERAAQILYSAVPLGGGRSAAGIAGGQAFRQAGFGGTSPAGIGLGLGYNAASAGAISAQNAANTGIYQGAVAGANTGQVGAGGFWASQVAGASAYAGWLKAIDDGQKQAARSGQAFGDAVASSLEDAVFNADSLSQAFEGVIQAALRAAFAQTVTAPLSGAIGGLFSAKGNVFSGGGLVPFAKGGVVSGPTVFPLNGGKSGVMGEAGPEAVMPLGRDAQGRLGVRGGGATVIQNFYGPTLDAKSRKQMRDDAQRVLR